MSEQDKLDFLDAESEMVPEKPEAKEDAPVEAAEPEVEAETPEPEDKGEKPEDTAPPAVGEKEARDVPLTVVLDEREKRQKAEAKLAELERWKAEQERKAQQPAPDWFSDPEAAATQQQHQMQEAIRSQHLRMSRFLAERDHGKDLVDEAYAYFDAHPQESHQLANHESPFHAAVEHYKRQKFLTEVGDPDKWLEAKKAEWLAEQATPDPEPEAPVRKKPPVSLASAPSAGRAEPNSQGSAFDAAFPD